MSKRRPRSAAFRRRSRAARKGWETRRRHQHAAIVTHGQRAREATEARLTPAQKAARTRAANRIERAIEHERRSDAARKGWQTREARGHAPRDRREIRSLRQLDDYGDYEGDEYDVETSPDYGED